MAAARLGEMVDLDQPPLPEVDDRPAVADNVTFDCQRVPGVAGRALDGNGSDPFEQIPT